MNAADENELAADDMCDLAIRPASGTTGIPGPSTGRIPTIRAVPPTQDRGERLHAGVGPIAISAYMCGGAECNHGIVAEINGNEEGWTIVRLRRRKEERGFHAKHGHTSTR